MAASLHIYLQMIKVGKDLDAQPNLGDICFLFWICIVLYKGFAEKNPLVVIKKVLIYVFMCYVCFCQFSV